MKRPPKYKKVLEALLALIDETGPGGQLPGIRQLKSQFEVGQSTIERALDEIVRRGLVSRKWGSGIYINGPRVKSGVIGVYFDTTIDGPNQRFLKGACSVLEPHGYKLKWFGSSRPDHKEMLSMLTDEDSFDGVIAKFSDQNMLVVQEEQSWSEELQGLKVPVSVYRPVPWVLFDSVTPDFTSKFLEIGAYMRKHAKGPIRFISNYGAPSFFRLWGFRAGLGDDLPFETIIGHGDKEGLTQSFINTVKSGWKGDIVLGAFLEPETLNKIFNQYSFEHLRDHNVVVVTHKEENLRVDFNLHIVVKTSFQMGKATARLLLRRLRGYQGGITHEVITERLYMAKKSKKRKRAVAKA